VAVPPPGSDLALRAWLIEGNLAAAVYVTELELMEQRRAAGPLFRIVR
jgi:hypothetical protein